MYKKSLTFKHVVYILFVIFGLMVAVPIIWIIFLTFKDAKEFYNSPLSLPNTFNFSNYLKAIEITHISRSYLNSIIITLSTILLSLGISIPAAFVFARLRFKFNIALYTFFVMGLVIPIISVIYPMFIIAKTLGIVNTYISVILPNIAFTIPTNMLILVGFMRSIPKDMEDAVVIDGGGMLDALFRMIVPICLPAISTVVIFDFLSSWNDFALSYILLTKDRMKTLPVVMTFFVGQYSTDYPAMAAGLIMSMVPILIFYSIFQRFIIEGMTAGAVKG